MSSKRYDIQGPGRARKLRVVLFVRHPVLRLGGMGYVMTLAATVGFWVCCAGGEDFTA